MYRLTESDHVTHKETSSKRVKRDEDDVRKLVNCFTSGLMSNPFAEETDSLFNFATGVVLPSDVAEGLVRSNEKGQEHADGSLC